MMADNHNTNEDEDILVTLDLDDGSQVECEILTIFTVNEQDYIALLPLTEAGEPNEDGEVYILSLIHISEPTRQAEISYAVFCLKKKKTTTNERNYAKDR